MPVQRPTLSTDNKWAKVSVDEGKGLQAETAESALTVILKTGLSGLASIILIVVGIVSGSFCFHFLMPVLEIVATYVMATVWSACS